jgi:D-alanyl-D-alanine dipeptidase
MSPVTRADHRRAAPSPRSATDGPAADTADLVLLCDPRITAIPVRDRGVALVDLAVVGVAVADRADGDRSHAYVRAPLAARLALADRLLPRGHRLLVVEGWRPMAEQARIWSTYEAQVRLAHPCATAAEVRRLTSRFVSPVEVAPHTSGGAVDLTLTGPDGPVDMGTEIDATPETSGGACYFAYRDLADPARSNRALLARVLRLVGLVNYPTEWWHWSFGDRYWAWAMGERSALFGPDVHPGHTIASGPAHPGR